MNIDAYLSTTPKRLAQDGKTVLVLALLLLALYLPGLGSYGLYDPWETHYGEVARNMVETNNAFDPWWGSPWDTDGVKREKEGFYSKPPLIMWMMAAGIELAGFNELGVRLFFPPLAILALLAVYLSVSRFYTRRAGLLAITVMATAPVFAIMSRQAVTDGPMVSIMVIGLMFLTQGLFLIPKEEASSRLSRFVVAGVAGFAIGGQLLVMCAMDRSPDIVRAYTGEGGLLHRAGFFFSEVFAVGRGKGWVISLLLLPLAVLAIRTLYLQTSRRLLYVYVFYISCGLVVPAKGWVEWAPVGITILAYCLLTRAWDVWRWINVPAGLLIVFMVGHPWVMGMLGGHHPGWYDRFIIHDHYNRIFHGVHSIDDGGFEYFIKQLGYGLFPFVALLPAAIMRVFGSLRGKLTELTPERRFELFVFLWALVAYFIFSKSMTKFHHYIFPAVPALCLLIAITLDDLLAGRARAAALISATAAAIAVWIGQDLYRMPRNFGDAAQNLVNLFTYKYDRDWPTFTSPEAIEKLTGEALYDAIHNNEYLFAMSGPLQWVTVFAVVGLLCMAWKRDALREYGVLSFCAAGVYMATFCLHHYLPTVGAAWSQKPLWDAYYESCTKFGPDEREAFQTHTLMSASRMPAEPESFPRAWCREPIVAFRTNWRGECYYSGNTVIPVPETKNFKPFLDEYKVGDGRPFFLFTERARVKSELEPNLPAWLKGKGTEVFMSGNKFVLFRFEAKKPPEPLKPASPGSVTPSSVPASEPPAEGEGEGQKPQLGAPL